MKFDYSSFGYIAYVLSHPFVKGSVTFLPSVFLLTLARLFPILSLAPFWGSKVLPRPARVGLGIALFFIMFPCVFDSITVMVSFNPKFLFLFIKELFIGASIGLVALAPFMIAETAGILIDHQRGSASFQVNDPLIQNMASPMGLFFNYFAIYLFYLMGGPILFLDTVLESFQVLPIDQFLNGLALARDASFWKIFITLYGTIIISGVKLAMPALLIILMTDTFLGIANRLAPQVQMVFLGMPLKALLGVAIVWLGWYTIIGYMAKFNMSWLEQVTNVIYSLKYF